MTTEPNVPLRFSLAGIIAGLMVADDLGDVGDEINHLHDLVGLERPEGNFADGWTNADLMRVGIPIEDDETNEDLGVSNGP